MEDGKFLVVDPGIRFMGYSVFASDDNVIESKTIKFNTKLSQEKRLFELYTILSDVASRNKLEHVVTEYQFVNVMSNIVGVIMAVAGSIDDVKFTKITPSSWKKTGFGKGNIPEDELSDKIIDIYPEAKEMSEHERDCLGMYIAYKKIINKDGGDPDVISKNAKKSTKRKKSSKN